MADLSEETVDALVAAMVPKIIEATGLSEAVAGELALSAIPPFDTDGGMIILRDAGGLEVARIAEEVLDPYGILESLE